MRCPLKRAPAVMIVAGTVGHDVRRAGGGMPFTKINTCFDVSSEQSARMLYTVAVNRVHQSRKQSATECKTGAKNEKIEISYLRLNLRI